MVVVVVIIVVTSYLGGGPVRGQGADHHGPPGGVLLQGHAQRHVVLRQRQDNTAPGSAETGPVISPVYYWMRIGRYLSKGAPSFSIAAHLCILTVTNQCAHNPTINNSRPDTTIDQTYP